MDAVIRLLAPLFLIGALSHARLFLALLVLTVGVGQAHAQLSGGGGGGSATIGPGSITGPNLAVGAACFNVGPWSGDLTGLCPMATLVPGTAARNLGSAAGDVVGPWSNLSLVPSSIFSKMGTPGGDLGGTSYSTPLVTGLNGFQLCIGAQPSPQSALVWTGTCYTPQNVAPGISGLNGDVLAGPGTGLQTASIQPQAVTNTKLALMPPMSLKANPAVSSGGAVPQDIPVTGGLAFKSGSLQLGSIGVSQQYTVVAGDCFTVNNGFITGIVPSTNCGTGGDALEADDGVTPLLADDSSTPLIVDGAAIPGTACLAWQTDFSVTTGCNLPFLLFLKV